MSEPGDLLLNLFSIDHCSIGATALLLCEVSGGFLRYEARAVPSDGLGSPDSACSSPPDHPDPS